MLSPALTAGAGWAVAEPAAIGVDGGATGEGSAGTRAGAGSGTAATGSGPGAATTAVAGHAPQRGHQAQVVEDHRPDVEDEGLRRLERVLDHVHQLPDLGFRLGRVAFKQPLDDLRLQHDVGQALGRPVVHSPGDLPAEVLLGGEDQS